MAVELKVPQVGESITEVQIGQWLKKEGDLVQKGETLVEIETDKVTVELPAPVAGRLGKLLRQGGEAARVGEVIGYVEEDGQAAASAAGAPENKSAGGPARDVGPEVAKTPAAGRAAKAAPADKPERAPSAPAHPIVPEAPPARPASDAKPDRPTELAESVHRPEPPAGGYREERTVPMSPLRRKVAERLVQAQQTAALLTTFNEIDMSAVLALRAKHQQAFQEKYGIKLGFMSFFVKASVDALKRFPAINAEIRGNSILYRNYYDVGVAVSTDKGLVVPVLANAERMSFAGIEHAITDFANRARDNKLQISELEGGTFTITNGGIFGSLLSTPIINPPQSGILGLHAIQDRPVAREGQVVIRPMMYVALTYDHRIVDGREAVTFLRRIKEVIEEPSRLLIEA